MRRYHCIIKLLESKLLLQKLFNRFCQLHIFANVTLVPPNVFRLWNLLSVLWHRLVKQHVKLLQSGLHRSVNLDAGELLNSLWLKHLDEKRIAVAHLFIIANIAFPSNEKLLCESCVLGVNQLPLLRTLDGVGVKLFGELTDVRSSDRYRVG